MDKINFEELPSTKTPISASNLNKLQDNVDVALQEIISTDFKRVNLNESTDFNSYTKNGFYQCNFQNGTNAPNRYATGMLLVFGGYYIAQLFVGNNGGTIVAYARMSGDQGATWLDWVQLG